MEEKYNLIKAKVLESNSTNPVEIAESVMREEYINMHGPEHHFLDGASFLVAYKNAGGDIEIEESLDELAKRTIKMPGAMCGLWGVCGSVTALGACLSIINKVSPLSTDEYYKHNMEYTSDTVSRMAKVGGARCCKRNAFTSLSSAVEFVNKKYGIKMELNDITCIYSSRNKQCIGVRCPYNK